MQSSWKKIPGGVLEMTRTVYYLNLVRLTMGPAAFWSKRSDVMVEHTHGRWCFGWS